MRSVVAALALSALFACTSSPGPAGPQGPEGPQGPIGASAPAPVIATDGGLIGTGSTASPLALDPNQVAAKGEANRIIEAEGPSDGGLAMVRAQTGASQGQVRFAPASAGTGGLVWRVGAPEVGPISNGLSVVSFSLAVTNNALSTPMATLRCGATRGTATVEVGPAVTIQPDLFLTGTVFRTVELSCAWQPGDTDQFIAVTDFVTGVTDLYLDYVRVVPLLRARAPWDGAVGTSENHAFCVGDGNGGDNYDFTRYAAATKCKTLGMRLCSVAELSAYAEADYASCCWGWTSDLGSNLSNTAGKVAFFMYSSQTTKPIAAGCAGLPGGMRFQDNHPATGLWAAHCCR